MTMCRLPLWPFVYSYREVGLPSVTFTFEVRFATCDSNQGCKVPVYFKNLVMLKLMEINLEVWVESEECSSKIFIISRE